MFSHSEYVIEITYLLQPYTHITVTSDEEETTKKQVEDNLSSNLTSQLSELTDASSQLDENKIESLDKKLQQQQVKP